MPTRKVVSKKDVQDDGRKRWTDKMEAHIRKGEGDFRDLENYALKHKDKDYAEHSSDGDPEAYYRRKYEGDKSYDVSKENPHGASYEGMHKYAHTPEGRAAMRRMISQGEADSIRVANAIEEEKKKKKQ